MQENVVLYVLYFNSKNGQYAAGRTTVKSSWPLLIAESLVRPSRGRAEPLQRDRSYAVLLGLKLPKLRMLCCHWRSTRCKIKSKTCAEHCFLHSLFIYTLKMKLLLGFKRKHVLKEILEMLLQIFF